MVATRTAATSPAPHPTVYAPWSTLLAQADARLKTEINAALRDLEQATATAGQILDSMSAYASESAARLEATAWDTWTKYMDAADATRNAILARATAAYDQAIALAHGQYDAALGDAEKTYQTIANDANAAKSVAGKIVA